MRIVKMMGLALVAWVLVAGTVAAQTLQEETIGDLEVLRDKYVGLAQAVPESSYTWRPGEGVRSVGEVYMHVVQANFGFPRMIGVTVPEGTPGAWTSGNAEGLHRADAVDALNASFDHMVAAVRGITAERLEEKMEVFGRPTNVRGFLVVMVTHLHEHLGQSIAYARTNGVVPPWSS